MLGISACTLCNFITIPRLFESFSGGLMGIAFIFSSVGFVNLLLLFLLGFFANKGRAYCQFLCPIGAIDGVVNRLGSRFRFTHRIRVERDRCSGCNVCARKCMTGAIKMVDRIAVVDQFSCMSCHECVDVCDWDAIKWTNAPLAQQPKRVKRNVEIHPLPMWTSVYHPHKQKKGIKKFNWSRIIAGVLFAVIVGSVSISQAFAAKRNSDPDGCLVCHALPDLNYIDPQGQLRNATINTKHYLSSLHGSIACTDCHQNLQYYPHKEENIKVDCAASCHLNEPSKGEAYSHKSVTQEFEQSIHNQGWSKGFSAANRIEDNMQASPSCRFCHSNTSYIPNNLLAKFKDTFAHTETECGSCHQGEVWLNQFSGHILRRLIGARWTKTDEVAMCNSCHDDPERINETMRHIYQESSVNTSANQQEHIGVFKNFYAKEDVTSNARFEQASRSYAMTLHARLITSGVEQGVSCLQCHAPNGYNHGIQSKYDPRSPTHQDNLAKTCASANCHTFSEHPNNQRFVNTDLHSIDSLNWLLAPPPLKSTLVGSVWTTIALLLFSLLILALLINVTMAKVKGKIKGEQGAFLGGDAFNKKVLNLKPKAKNKNKPVKKVGNKNASTTTATGTTAPSCPLTTRESDNALDATKDKAKQKALALAKAKAKAKKTLLTEPNENDASIASEVSNGCQRAPASLSQEQTDEKAAMKKAAIARAKTKAKEKALQRAQDAKYKENQ